MNTLLRIISLGALSAATYAFYLVTERALAAAWQAYKFFGYEETGYISLSARTGIVFLILSATVFAISFYSQKIGVRRGVRDVVAASKFAMIIVTLAVIVYVVLGFSPLNHWRV